MNSQTWPWPFVDSLIRAFGLNECEAADLSDRAQRFLDIGLGRDITSKADVAERLWQRADMLLNQGSPMQVTWDAVKRATRQVSQSMGL
jgi:hypothetical protein